MSTCNHPDTPAICAHCPHNHANADIGQQITYLISQLTTTERAQLLKLIDGILTASHQQRQPAPRHHAKRSKQR